jgi:hypothetical protein
MPKIVSTRRIAVPAVALALVAVACQREPPTRRIAAQADPALEDPPQGVRFDGAITFAGGVVVRDATVSPSPLRPGESVHVAFDVQGTPASGRVVLSPPRTGGRQVALGGLEAARAEPVPPDDRVRAASFEQATGRVEVELAVPSPWHPKTAMITVELGPGTQAIDGPRTAAGAGVLALVPVAVTPTHAVAVHATAAIAIDGALDEPAWQAATVYRLADSRDGEPIAEAITQVRFAWDDTALFVGAQLQDDDAWSEYRAQDDPLWKQEAFEVFVFGDAAEPVDDPAIRRDYLELQVSPRGVTFDARFAEYRKGDEAWDSAWKTAVQLRGDVDDRRGRDEGWTVEVAIPWDEICAHTSATCPPRAQDRLRINVFRLERPQKGAPLGLALSPTRVSDFHAPQNAAILELAS